MADTFCGHCGTRKKPLAYSTYCPNDCDRLVPRREEARRDFFEVLERSTCPACGTFDVEPFADCDVGDMHCIPNGHVWWNKD